MPAVVDTAFEIAYWLSDAALNDNEYLQPQKLQRLLYLAQGYYAVLNGGRRLMPAVFVADEGGPIEPNVHAALARGRPPLDLQPQLPNGVEAVLEGVWARFGAHSVDKLDRLTRATAAYREARERGLRAEIEHAALWWSFACADQTPAAANVVRPTMLRTQDGRPVVVRAWSPPPAGATPAGRARPGDAPSP